METTHMTIDYWTSTIEPIVHDDTITIHRIYAQDPPPN